MLKQLTEAVHQQLDASPGSPKYLCMRDAVIDLIASGHWPEGTRLPTEQAMAEVLPVSLGTIQKALKVLVDSGDLHRKRRMGTFVAGGDHRRAIGTPSFSFVRPDGSLVKMVFIKVLKQEISQRTGPWSNLLGKCDAGYVHWVRQDGIDGAFYCHTEVYLRADWAPHLSQLPTAALEHQSLIPLLQEQGLVPHWLAENRVSPVTLPAATVKVIWPKSPPEKPQGLRLETRYLTPDGQAFAWQVMHIPANDYQLSTTVRSH